MPFADSDPSSSKIFCERHPLHAATQEAYNSRDVERWAALYEQGAALDCGNWRAVGREQIRQFLQRLIALRGSLATETVCALEVGDILLLRGKFCLSFAAAGDERRQRVAHTAEVAKCGSDGQWRFITARANAVAKPVWHNDDRHVPPLTEGRLRTNLELEREADRKLAGAGLHWWVQLCGWPARNGSDVEPREERGRTV